MAAPPANWQASFQQGFRQVSERFQSGASQFGQAMQTGMYGAQTSFQGAASRASTAMRGYSQRFTNNYDGGGGGGGGAGFSQMTSANPQFGAGSFGSYTQSPAPPPRGMGGGMGMGGGGMASLPEKPMNAQDQYHNDDGSRCTTKTLLGLVTIFLILVASGAGVGVLFSVNDARRNAAQNGLGAEAGNTTDNGDRGDGGPSNGAFNIEIIFISSVSQAQRDAFISAKNRWQQVIVGDIAVEAELEKGDSFCGITINQKTEIDDILIFADISAIDGTGRILGQAGPCGFDENDMPRLGLMRFDSADVEQLIATDQFTDVVLHEMGHVLGLGSLWDTPNDLLTPANPNNPTGPVGYLGRQGNQGHVEIGGSGTQAVVENLGGAGTARGHWKDTVYQNELMTGFLSPGRNPMSRMTVRALADLGYQVDVSRADDFRVGSGRRLRGDAGGPRLDVGNDIFAFPGGQLRTREKGSAEAYALREMKRAPRKRHGIVP